MKNFGLKISKEDKNVTTVADPEIVFSRLFQTLPVFNIIKKEYSLPALDNTRRYVKHGLPFVPFCLIFYKSSTHSDRWQFYPSSGVNPLSPSGQDVLLDRVDKENVSFVTSDSSGSSSILTVAIVVFTLPVALSL